MAESKLLEDAGPNDQLIFKAVLKGSNGDYITDSSGENVAFNPLYYPDRFNKVMEKELNREGNQCQGEDVTIKNFKNSDIHATGICRARHVSVLKRFHAHDGAVDLFTPISPNGGIEAIVKKVEIGEKAGWHTVDNALDESNVVNGEWMFNYTIDFVSTGFDEYGSDGENEVVTNILN